MNWKEVTIIGMVCLLLCCQVVKGSREVENGIKDITCFDDFVEIYYEDKTLELYTKTGQLIEFPFGTKYANSFILSDHIKISTEYGLGVEYEKFYYEDIKNQLTK